MTRVSMKRPSRLVEHHDPNDRGRGPQLHEVTRRATTRGGYLLQVRHPEEHGDNDKDHDGCRVAQDS
jgi:hypothetical protein